MNVVVLQGKLSRAPEARETGQQRRLPDAVDPGERDDLARGHGQVDVLEDDHAAVRHAQPADRHHRISHENTI